MNRLRNSFFLAWITLILSSVPALSQSGGVVELDRIFIEHDVHSGFGEDVDFAGDLDGDGVPEILIGAPSFDAGGLWSAGAVYVFSGATGALIRRIDGWEQYASFGRAVCNPGDVNGDGVDDILIGAQDAPQTGSAYLYSGASFQILHHFQGNVFQGAFGYSVAGAGDVDGNGLPDVIVGAPGPRSQKGSVFVYSGQTGALLHQIDPKGRVEDFGFSVSTAGDVNQDGHDDLLIGAPVTWHGIRKGGSAFIYSGKGGHLLFQVDGLYEEGRFGESVAYVGDINGDGYPDHAVGSPGAEATKKESGAVFVFSGADGSQIYFEPGRKVNQKLGYDVSYAGDVDGDGFPDILASSGWGRRYIANRELVSGLFVISGADGEILVGDGGRYRTKYQVENICGGADVNGDGRADFLGGSHFSNGPAGMVFLQSFYPGLSPKLQSISASLGGQLRFDIDFPATSAGNRYVLLASAAGRGSESIFGMPVPLDFDKLSYAMFYGPPRGFFQTRGKLDANGNATAWFQANPGQLNPYLGMPIWFSAVSSARYFGDSFASVAVLASVIP